jgi:hypothetical protein
MRTILTLLSSIIIASATAPALSAEDTHGLNCLLELELPQFATANLVPQGGEVVAHVILDSDGKPKEIKLTATEPHLSMEIEYQLRERAKYRPGCSAKEVALEFSFRVEGKAVPSPFAKILFIPPNRFVITTQPVQSNPDSIPLGPDAGHEKRGVTGSYEGSYGSKGDRRIFVN